MSRRAPSWSAALLLALVILTTSPAAGQERAGEAELAEALQQLHLRSFARGRELLTSLLARPELDRQVEERARQQLERLQRRFTVHTQRIGLLAPLSGRYRQIGEAVVQGAELALQLDGGPTVVREDSQGTPEGAAAAVERLVLEQGVVALLGPVGDRE
ncbi:MAG: hypothetical protein FJ125_07720, partial [Deltaproteobacteria bacterium]|nr:hypothetical protein [Deltaproteobacteria bacterium]